jgi:hypothetical protein
MYYIERSECWYVSTEDTDLEDGCVEVPGQSIHLYLHHLYHPLYL